MYCPPAGGVSKLHPCVACQQDRGDHLRYQCLPAPLYHQRGKHQSVKWEVSTGTFIKVCVIHAASFSQAGNMSRVLERVNGVARCPYDPRHNSTAVVTESGELYAATVIDFSGRDPVIYRSLGGMPPLRTAQYNSKWLNGTLISSSHVW